MADLTTIFAHTITDVHGDTWSNAVAKVGEVQVFEKSQPKVWKLHCTEDEGYERTDEDTASDSSIAAVLYSVEFWSGMNTKSLGKKARKFLHDAGGDELSVFTVDMDDPKIAFEFENFSGEVESKVLHVAQWHFKHVLTA